MKQLYLARDSSGHLSLFSGRPKWNDDVEAWMSVEGVERMRSMSIHLGGFVNDIRWPKVKRGECIKVQIAKEPT